MEKIICIKCKLEKNLSDFYFDKKRKRKVYPRCKLCEKQRAKERYLKDPTYREKRCSGEKAYRRTPKALKSRLLSYSKKRAKQKNIEHNITEDDIELPEYCPIFKNMKLESNSKTIKDNSYTIDRIDPKKGYVRGNVKVISSKANRLKNNMSLEEILLLAEYIKENIL